MAELCMRVCRKLFSIFNHVLDSSVGSVGSSVIYIDRFEFNVEGGDIAGIESNDIFSDNVYFLSRNMLIFLLDGAC